MSCEAEVRMRQDRVAMASFRQGSREVFHGVKVAKSHLAGVTEGAPTKGSPSAAHRASAAAGSDDRGSRAAWGRPRNPLCREGASPVTSTGDNPLSPKCIVSCARFTPHAAVAPKGGAEPAHLLRFAEVSGTETCVAGQARSFPAPLGHTPTSVGQPAFAAPCRVCISTSASDVYTLRNSLQYHAGRWQHFFVFCDI